MKLETNLQGRVRNTSLPYRHGLLPMFEAVVNSIHAIEEAQDQVDKGEIRVEIIRSKQQDLDFSGDKGKKRGSEVTREIIGFKIIDNGVGFNKNNMQSFLTLDSDYKAKEGGRGIGRLLWLKAFRKVNVRSVFQDEDGIFRIRTFVFDASGVRDEANTESSSSKRSTSVHLDGFLPQYRQASYKTVEAIASALFEHCLWYFVRKGGAPNIIVFDESESVSLDDVYREHMLSSAQTESIEIKGENFDIVHIKLRSNSSNSHVMALCAAKRLVKKENIEGKIPGLYGKLHDEAGDFVYACYVTSSFLDERVRAERTDFDILEKPSELFAGTEISLSDIKDAVFDKISIYLASYLEENKNKARERIEKFISRKAPRYRPILKRIPESKLFVDPNISDKELDLHLHKQLAEIEQDLLATGHDLLEPKKNENFPDYHKRLQEYLQKVEDIKKSDLANYVSHRRVILELLETAIQRGENGKYAREDLIHNLIMPMRVDSNEVMMDSCNLWLIDERLAFHDYLASDKTLSSMPITGSEDTKEPDILALNVFDTPILVSEGDKLPLASIVVIEIKRPMRDDAVQGETKDPIEQTINYLDRIRQGKVYTAKGRLIPNSENIPGFCYIICDITPSIKKRCEIMGLTPTHDHLGYFGYNPNYKAYIEVISFDRLINAAKERIKAFFDKLGLPTT
ncbi:MAG: hypothetical protein Kow0037_22050 [Calditrichia bacterium]